MSDARGERLAELARLEILSRAWGQDAPSLIDPPEELARLLREQGRLDEALSLEKRTGELRARSGGQGFLPSSANPPVTRVD